MQIFSNPDRDISTPKPAAGSYEWWYFDAISNDGKYSVVVIFYEGNPFSRRYMDAIENGKNNRAEEYPAVSISIYKNKEPIFYSFEEVLPADSEFSTDWPQGRVKENMFQRVQAGGGKLIYQLNLNQSIANGDHLHGSLRFTSWGQAPNFQSPADKKRSEDTSHQWNLIQPLAVTEGELKIDGFTNEVISFKGRGYHDHNMGMEPMKESFIDWYWGRFHFPGYSLIYYLMNEENGRRDCAWLIDQSNNVSELNGNFELLDAGLNVFGLKSARKIELGAGDTSFLIQQETTLDDGPFYQRFHSRLMIKLDGKLHQATGISEYICPGRIYTKLFRPLVNMRINYPDKTHWVQKNPRLYRWTW